PMAAISRLGWMRMMFASLAALGWVVLGVAWSALAAEPAAWEPWQRLVGVVDLGGPRSDGTLVAVAAGRLSLVSADGRMSPFARGVDGFRGSVAGEPYLAVARTLPVASAGCSFAQDDIYILDLTSPPGVARVDPAGHASRFATFPGLDTLNGITFDTTG